MDLLLVVRVPEVPKDAPKMAPRIPAKSTNGSVSKVDDQIGSKILTPTGKGSKNGILRTNSMRANSYQMEQPEGR